MILTPRLAAVAAFVPPCGTLADIGTDHAYIPIHLLRKGVVRRAVASDVAAGPARAALANVKAYGLESRVEIVIGDGLEKIGAVDVIVMAGMGGKLICDILDGGAAAANRAELLVLQPMTAVCEVRRYLREKNFTIRGEVIAKEGKRLYNVMTAAKNHAAKQAEPPDDAIYDYIGKRLITAAKTARETVGEGYAPLGEYITRRVNALTVAIETMRGGADTAEKRAEFTALRARLLEVYHDCYGGGHSK